MLITCCRLLSFINLSERGPKCVHMLPPDPSKDHRTKVCISCDESEIVHNIHIYNDLKIRI